MVSLATGSATRSVSILILLAVTQTSHLVHSFTQPSFSSPSSVWGSTSSVSGRINTALAVRNRGLENRSEGGATPSEGGMTLYVKAGPDGTSIGDCPFAHYVRMVLHEKNLSYDLRPATPDTKPKWLMDYYEGKMPALRHGSECYTESDIVAEYLDFFFQEPALVGRKGAMADARDAVEGLFPVIARYIKHTTNGDEEDGELKENLESVLKVLEEYLGGEDRAGPYLVDEGGMFSLVDCSLVPKLHVLKVGLEAFKENAIDIAQDFPALHKYMTASFERPSFVDTVYPDDTLIWGWTGARE